MLILVLDKEQCTLDCMPDLIKEAVFSGVTDIQWRDKIMSDREFYHQGVKLAHVCRELSVPLWINDRVDVAVLLGADGIHLGQSDLSPKDVSRIIPANMRIGLSAENLDDVVNAQAEDLDYLAISPVFATATKTDVAKPFGLEGLRLARQISKHRLIAIGGIHAGNVRDVYESGADGVAAVSAIRSLYK